MLNLWKYLYAEKGLSEHIGVFSPQSRSSFIRVHCVFPGKCFSLQKRMCKSLFLNRGCRCVALCPDVKVSARHLPSAVVVFEGLF